MRKRCRTPTASQVVDAVGGTVRIQPPLTAKTVELTVLGRSSGAQGLSTFECVNLAYSPVVAARETRAGRSTKSESGAHFGLRLGVKDQGSGPISGARAFPAVAL